MATILAVDDDPGIVLFLGDAVRNLGHAFVSARDGAQALRMAREQKPDLVLLDVELPRMSGYDLCARLKAMPSWAGVPVVFMSVRGKAEDRRPGLELGAIDYLPKPFSIAELVAKLRTLLAMRGTHQAPAQESLLVRKRMDGPCEGHSLDLVEVKGKGLKEVPHATCTAGATSLPPALVLSSPIIAATGVRYGNE